MRSQTSAAGAERGHVELVCCKCGARYADRRIACEVCPDSLLRSEYSTRTLSREPRGDVFEFGCWLPGRAAVRASAAPRILDGGRYGRRLGLTQLSLAFNGYWPERGACNPTGTFKDLEAAPTVAYLRDHGIETVVLASAGNTARAFAYACCDNAFGCWIVVPESMCHRLWLPRRPHDGLKTIAVRGADYGEAIRLSEVIAARCGIPAEGGVRNVARRDGIGTILLAYAVTCGRLPDAYVQAVGSGAGAIAIYEAAVRLRADGRFGEWMPRFTLVQNASFAPIHDAWSAEGGAAMASADRHDSEGVFANVLANSRPPYSMTGGVRDVLEATNGCTCAVGRREALEAQARFEAAEGVAIDEPSACACAGLEMAVRAGRVRREDHVLLNITGASDRLIRRDHTIHVLTPDVTLSGASTDQCLETLIEMGAL
jgi:cysteate synthase